MHERNPKKEKVGLSWQAKVGKVDLLSIKSNLPLDNEQVYSIYNDQMSSCFERGHCCTTHILSYCLEVNMHMEPKINIFIVWG